MAVTTEPPWTNNASGAGARNGTTTHTIGHSSAATAPSSGCSLGFVPTAGRLLVVFVAGGVTHTSSGTGAGSGWTEQQQPVDSSELSMFTKTAVGNDFLTLTHNGSNFPINWAVYEFPDGSSYTASTSATGTDHLLPALGSLPGTQQVIIAALCNGMPGSTAGSGGCAVLAPSVEDTDIFSATGTTQGVYLYTFHQINTTAATVTPSLTFNVIGTVNADSQKIVAAFDVAVALQVKAQRVHTPTTTDASVSAVIATSTAAALAPRSVGVTSWLNRANNIGARNGTTVHTIGGASPSAGCVLGFTPTAGRLLVAFVAGAVTHTSSGTGAGSGWTKQQSALNSQELAMFTKTAVGNDFLTVTHNASNYPIGWAVYEFTPGSTYTTSIGSTSSDDVFPTLTGLPGTPQFVLGALCHGYPAGGVVTGCNFVSAPWLEDSDSLTTGAPTENNYLFNFHQPNVTATSVTPTITFGFTGQMNDDRQKIVAAVALGGGSVGGTARPFHSLQEYFHDGGGIATNQTTDLGFDASSFKAVLTSGESSYVSAHHGMFAYFCLPHNLVSPNAESFLANTAYPQSTDASYVSNMQSLVSSYGQAGMFLFMCPEWDNDPANQGWATNRFSEAGVGGSRPDLPTGLTRQQAYDQWMHFYLANHHGGIVNHHQLGQILGQTLQARGYKTLANNSAAGTAFFGFEMGFDMITLQRNNDDIGGLIGSIGLIRGAATQYGKQWGIDISHSRSYGLPGVTSFNGSQGLTAGWSMATYKRTLYLAYMCGPDTIFSEAADHQTNGATTINGRTYNPLGATFQAFNDYALTRHPQRGIPHVPVAVMKDHISSWEPKFGQFNQGRAVWIQQMGANNGENMMYNLWDVIYPNYSTWATSTTSAEPWGRGTWGEQFDVITERITGTPLAQYGAVIVATDAVMDSTLQAKLNTFAQNGGIVVLNAKQLSGTAHESLTGIHLTGTFGGSSPIIWNSDSSTTTEGSYNYSTCTLLTATQIAHTAADVSVTKNVVGAGQVWVVLPDYMSNSANNTLLGVGSKVIDTLVKQFEAATISGGSHTSIDWCVNRNAGSSGAATAVTIINTHASGTTWTGTVKVPGAGTPVREWVTDTTPSSTVSGGYVNVTASVPGGEVRIYAVG